MEAECNHEDKIRRVKFNTLDQACMEEAVQEDEFCGGGTEVGQRWTEVDRGEPAPAPVAQDVLNADHDEFLQKALDLWSKQDVSVQGSRKVSATTFHPLPSSFNIHEPIT